VTRAVAAYKYTTGAQPPAHLNHVAVVEVETGVGTPPPHMPLWDVTYYSPGDSVPGNLAQYAAWAYTVADTLPAWLRAVATWVAATTGLVLSGHGHLNFSHDVDAHHIVTLGL